MTGVLGMAREAATKLPANWRVEVLWSPHLGKDVGWVAREAGTANTIPLADLQRRDLRPQGEEAKTKEAPRAAARHKGQTAESGSGPSFTMPGDNRKGRTSEEEEEGMSAKKYETKPEMMTKEYEELLVKWKWKKFKVSVPKTQTMGNVMRAMKKRTRVKKAMFLHEGMRVRREEKVTKFATGDSWVVMVGEKEH